MKLLPLTNLGRKLRPKYRSPITACIFAFIITSFAPTIWFALWLAHSLGLKADAPLNQQPDGVLWTMLFLGFAGASMIVFYLASFIFMAVVLRISYGWTWDRIRELMLESRIPTHWFESGNWQA